MPNHLPDPRWTEMSESCVGCGYNLTGLAPAGRCPECGAAYDGRQLVLCGVPRRSSSGARRWASGLALGGAISYVYLIGLFIFVSWLFALALGISIVAVLVVLIVTSRRERGGAERFVLCSAGIARLPLKPLPEAAPPDSLLIPWSPDYAYELRRISTVWYRLRIGTWGDHRRALKSVVFDAGVRCPDAAALQVREAIEQFLQRVREDGTLNADATPGNAVM